MERYCDGGRDVLWEAPSETCLSEEVSGPKCPSVLPPRVTPTRPDGVSGPEGRKSFCVFCVDTTLSVPRGPEPDDPERKRQRSEDARRTVEVPGVHPQNSHFPSLSDSPLCLAQTGPHSDGSGGRSRGSVKDDETEEPGPESTCALPSTNRVNSARTPLGLKLIEMRADTGGTEPIPSLLPGLNKFLPRYPYGVAITDQTTAAPRGTQRATGRVSPPPASRGYGCQPIRR